MPKADGSADRCAPQGHGCWAPDSNVSISGLLLIGSRCAPDSAPISNWTCQDAIFAQTQWR
jgi:hypothetical protein